MQSRQHFLKFKTMIMLMYYLCNCFFKITFIFEKRFVQKYTMLQVTRNPRASTRNLIYALIKFFSGKKTILNTLMTTHYSKYCVMKNFQVIRVHVQIKIRRRIVMIEKCTVKIAFTCLCIHV